jgi:hypothetical protein
MKYTLLRPFFFVLLASAGSSLSAQQIYRCVDASSGTPEYINNVKDAQTRNCNPVLGGNVTVVQGTPVPKAPAARATPASGPRNEGNSGQRARDSDSRLILESELKKSEARLAEQLKDYNNGEPEKQGIEGRNYQRYLDRVAELKESIARSQGDIAGLKREIARLPGAN